MDKGKTYQLELEDFRKIFDQLFDPLCLFAHGFLKNPQIAEDTVQEVFIRIWEKKVSFKDEDTIKSFLYTSVRNKSLDHLRSKHYKHVNSNLDIEQLESEAYFLNEVFFYETDALIENALEALPKKCAQVIRLSMFEYTNKQIAEEMRISVRTVSSHKTVGHKRLKDLLYPLKKAFSFFTIFF